MGGKTMRRMSLLSSWWRKRTQVSSRAPRSAVMLALSSPSMLASVMITSFRRKGNEFSSSTDTSNSGDLKTRPQGADTSPIWTRDPGDLRDPRDAGPVRTRDPSPKWTRDPRHTRDARDRSPVRTRDPRDSRDPRATQDDLAVLTFGVLQLSNTLDRVRETTGGRVQDLAGPLGTHRAWLVQMLGLQSQNDAAREALAQVQLEDRELWTREKAMEYSDVLRILQLFTREQQGRMDAQAQQLSRLQLTVAQAFPETPAT
ncbi:hypothetical protein CRUP_016132 [Coryphaenoides rupestris]|nr:hypothetical protein CRUP_016132 [Coryphaenoides rupestris]